MNFGIGVIGATGYIGTPYRDEMRECDGVRMVALCARRRDRLEAAGQTDGADLITHEWREVVEHPDVNLVVVATPDALHHEAVIACADKGKHLLCEKPVGINATEAQEMWSVYRDAGLGHYVPYWTRYVPAFARARELFREGAIGEVCGVIYRWHNPRPASMPYTWRDNAKLSAAGSIADVGSHAYDAVRWIIGEEATRVLAHADVITPAKPDLGEIDLTEAIDWGTEHDSAEVSATARGQNVETYKLKKGTAYDYANIIWQFSGGAVGSIVLSHASVLRKGLSCELEIHGTTGSLGIDRINSRITIVRNAADIEVEESIDDPGFGNRFDKHVFPAIREQLASGALDHPNLKDGWRVQLFTDAAVASAQSGTWVDVSN